MATSTVWKFDSARGMESALELLKRLQEEEPAGVTSWNDIAAFHRCEVSSRHAPADWRSTAPPRVPAATRRSL
jgi:hypothetical protein